MFYNYKLLCKLQKIFTHAYMANGRTNYKYTINEYYNYALCGFQSKDISLAAWEEKKLN
jgi:hypothetical protein